MYSGFKSQCIPHYHLLTEDQIKRLHTATLELLETVGVEVQHDAARRMMNASPPAAATEVQTPDNSLSVAVTVRNPSL